MTAVQTTKMSSRGQVVIPQSIREELGLQDGELLTVTSINDGLLLKKVVVQSKEEIWKDWLKFHEKEAKEIVKRLKIREEDIVDIIHARRRSKE